MRLDISGPNNCDCLCTTGTGTFPSTPGCSTCDDPPPCWWVDLTGVSDDSNNNFCTEMCNFLGEGFFDRGLWNVDLAFACLWQGQWRAHDPLEDHDFGQSGCCGHSVAFGTLEISVIDYGSIAPCLWIVIISLRCLHQRVVLARYEINDCSYNCDGPLTLNLVGSEDFACDWPETIRIIPNRSCLGTDTGTGTPSPPGPGGLCADLFCRYEWQSPGQWVLIDNNCIFSSESPCGCNIPPPMAGNEEFGDIVFIVCDQL